MAIRVNTRAKLEDEGLSRLPQARHSGGTCITARYLVWEEGYGPWSEAINVVKPTWSACHAEAKRVVRGQGAKNALLVLQ